MNSDEKLNHLHKLRKHIASCRRCGLHQSRINAVYGEGDPHASIMLIGEAPGAKEDQCGKPFVGRAGEILNELLASIGVTREKIYLCNVLKCRPPENRKPAPDEMESCAIALGAQIKIVDPAVIGPMGTFATRFIFQKYGLPFLNISSVVGKNFPIPTPHGKKVIVPVFHPAVAVYNINKKAEMLKHFRTFKKYI